jgi:hypothetical protein
MAISRKPKKEAAEVSEAAIKAVIEKGGSVAQDNPDAKKKNLQLRLDADLINQIDAARKSKSVPPSRHTWILEAIYEKLNS